LLHLVSEAIFPDLQGFFSPAVVALVLLSFGIWVGYRAVQAGGNYITVIVAGVILGILPLILQIVGFGWMLDRGWEAGKLHGIFGFDTVVFGSLIGGGFALSK
jgi:hypothetical protein